MLAASVITGCSRNEPAPHTNNVDDIASVFETDVSEPRKLAEYLLRNDPEWPAARIREVMLSGTETAVKLTDARPVLIEYFTSWVDRAGQLHFRDDVYGHDQRLATELFR